MLNHISIGVRDIGRAKAFYDAALNPLGYKALSESETSLGYGKEAVAWWISKTGSPVPADENSGLHFCFDAPTQPAEKTTARPGCGPTTARTITPHS
jgi:catechol 2,3-dioxygenase-like lactoylglutathione lyase family enzyme